MCLFELPRRARGPSILIGSYFSSSGNRNLVEIIILRSGIHARAHGKKIQNVLIFLVSSFIVFLVPLSLVVPLKHFVVPFLLLWYICTFVLVKNIL